MRACYACLALLCFATPALAQQPEPDSAAAARKALAREIQATARFLASDALGGREAGAPGARIAAQYIASRFEALGLRPAGDGGGWLQPFKFADGKRTGRNVIGLLPGTTDEAVVVGAHYDHLGRKDTFIFNGADDNASGVAVMLAVARALSRARGPKRRRGVLFIAFDAEERGLLGSKHYCKAPVVPLAKTALMLNLDMLGRDFMDAFGAYLFVTGTDSAAGLPALVGTALGGSSGFTPLAFGDPVVSRFFATSDHRPFRDARVPYLFFSTGMHRDYHKVTDTADKLKADKMARLAQAAARLVAAAATAEARPVFRKPTALVTDTDRSALKAVVGPVLAFGPQMGLDPKLLGRVKAIYAQLTDTKHVWTAETLDAACGELSRLMRGLVAR